jgi:hypothetical protein
MKKELSEVKQNSLLLGYLCVAMEKDSNLNNKVQILDRFGFTIEEIARICDCKPQSIMNARQVLKKTKKKK